MTEGIRRKKIGELVAGWGGKNLEETYQIRYKRREREENKGRKKRK